MSGSNAPLVVLTAVTMCAFAANSVLNRLAVGSGAIDASSFAVLRVLFGAITLWLLVRLRGGRVPFGSPGRVLGAVSLALYMVGFSLAYVTLDAGLGALILFGTVQVVMFAWSTLRGAMSTLSQILGACVAFAGLVLALWPTDPSGGDATGALLMVVAGIGWAAYTLAGRGAADPLAETAGNFGAALPLMLGLLLFGGLHTNGWGIALAFVSGALTSGLGYALWYRVLPRLAPQTAAVVQLSVPIIAIVAGAMLLGEAVGGRLVLAATLVLSGIALTTGVIKMKKPR